MCAYLCVYESFDCLTCLASGSVWQQMLSAVSPLPPWSQTTPRVTPPKTDVRVHPAKMCLLNQLHVFRSVSLRACGRDDVL